MKRITVFCGSSFGTDEIYEKQAFKLGEILAERKIGLVYGGANVGLMNQMENYIAPTIDKWIIRENNLA